MGLSILVTGCGAPGAMGTYYALKQSFGAGVVVHGCDINSDNVGNYIYDATCTVPRPSEDFIETLLSYCQQQNIKIIIPHVTNELCWFAKSKAKFESLGITVLVSSEGAINLANDKLALIKLCQELNLACAPEVYAVESKEMLLQVARQLGYPEKPVVVKSPVSNGMRGLRILHAAYDRLHDFLHEKPSTINMLMEDFLGILPEDELPPLFLTEYLPGEEFSVDVLANAGEMLLCLPRRRDMIRSGISFVTSLESNEEIIDFCGALVRACGLSHTVGFQFKRAYDGTFKILESNPRVQGTMVASVFANANIIGESVRLALGLERELYQSQIDWNARLFRYWGAIGVNDEQNARI